MPRCRPAETLDNEWTMSGQCAASQCRRRGNLWHRCTSAPMRRSSRNSMYRSPTRPFVAWRLLALAASLVCAHAAAFDFEDVARRAAALSAQAYKAPPRALPKALQELTYDQYREIRFKPARAIWRAGNLPFELQLFHPGLYY